MRISHRFSKEKRLPSKREYARVFAEGKKLVNQDWILIHRPTDKNSLSARIGFAISKKKVPRANERNRLKRLLRESFRQCAPQLPAVDCVFMARSKGQSGSNQEIYERLFGLWKKLTAFYGPL